MSTKWRKSLPSLPHYVYALRYEIEGVAYYYVGITVNVRARLSHHRSRYQNAEFCGLVLAKDRYEAVYIESVVHAAMREYGAKGVELCFRALGCDWT